jgi:hypothetical protein
VRGHDPQLDEVVEVGEGVEAGEIVDVVGRQLQVVARGDLQQRGRAHRAFEVDVELDLRDGRDGHADSWRVESG